MRPGLRQLALLVSTAAVGTSALAFSLIGSRWLDPQIIFHVGMSGTSLSGTTWSSALVDAMNQWNAQSGFTFVADSTPVDPCSGLSRSNSGVGFPAGNGDGLNSADFRTSVCGNNFGSSVLALTLNLTSAGQLGFREISQTDIVFNANFQWDIYNGPQQTRLDFRRVALHEFGHALGLDHETGQAAIMAPTIGSLHTLQADDIAGVNAIYGGSSSCLIRDLAANAVINDSLQAGDCRVLDLFGGSDDTSFVDVYRLRLAKTTDLDIVMHSSELDAVLILANASLGNLEIHDDFDGQCDAHIRKRLPAGEYRILANTYVIPEKCAGNVGGYSLTVSSTGLPLLGSVKNAAGGTVIANAVFTGGATADAGGSFATTFTATQAIDVLAHITPDPVHVGEQGSVYVLAVLGDGRQFMKDSTGRFVPFAGGLTNLVPLRTGQLAAEEAIAVASGLRGDVSGLRGHTISVFTGYALASAPQEIWYGSTPIRFTINP